MCRGALTSELARSRNPVAQVLYLVICKRRLFSYLLYSILLHLPPHIFHCVGGCWDQTQYSPLLGNRVDNGIGLSYRPANICSRTADGPVDNPYAIVNFIPPVRDYELGLRNVATWTLAVRSSNHSARSNPQSDRSHACFIAM